MQGGSCSLELSSTFPGDPRAGSTPAKLAQTFSNQQTACRRQDKHGEPCEAGRAHTFCSHPCNPRRAPGGLGEAPGAELCEVRGEFSVGAASSPFQAVQEGALQSVLSCCTHSRANSK